MQSQPEHETNRPIPDAEVIPANLGAENQDDRERGHAEENGPVNTPVGAGAQGSEREHGPGEDGFEHGSEGTAATPGRPSNFARRQQRRALVMILRSSVRSSSRFSGGIHSQVPGPPR